MISIVFRKVDLSWEKYRLIFNIAFKTYQRSWKKWNTLHVHMKTFKTIIRESRGKAFVIFENPIKRKRHRINSYSLRFNERSVTITKKVRASKITTHWGFVRMIPDLFSFTLMCSASLNTAEEGARPHPKYTSLAIVFHAMLAPTSILRIVRLSKSQTHRGSLCSNAQRW